MKRPAGSAQGQEAAVLVKWKPPTPSTNEDTGHHTAGDKVSEGSKLGGGVARGVSKREDPAGHAGRRSVEEGHVQWGRTGNSGRRPPAHPGVGQEDGAGSAGGRVLTYVPGWAQGCGGRLP